jgi:hypothetical protein
MLFASLGKAYAGLEQLTGQFVSTTMISLLHFEAMVLREDASEARVAAEL